MTCSITECAGISSNDTIDPTYFNEHVTECTDCFITVLNTTGPFANFNPAQCNAVRSYISGLVHANLQSYSSSDPVPNSIRALCENSELPGTCTPALSDYCSTYTRQQILDNPNLSDLCGCYSPPDPIYGRDINKACDPLCRRATTLPGGTCEDDRVATCPDTVCVIDDVVIKEEMVNNPNINIRQICTGCSAANPCYCVITGVTVNGNSSVLPTDVRFDQLCGTNSICSMGDGNFAPCVSPTTSPSWIRWLLIILVSSLIFIGLIVLIFLVVRRKPRKEGTTS